MRGVWAILVASALEDYICQVNESTTQQVKPQLHPATGIGKVGLNVANLEAQIGFYANTLGLVVLEHEEGRALLGTARRPLIELFEVPGARRFGGRTGLYHYAILYPDRRELARAIARLISLRIPNHPTDHIMTKATYFKEPEGQEIELYAESPEDGTMGIRGDNFFAIRKDGTPSNGVEALDLEALFTFLRDGDDLTVPIPDDSVMGHVHLWVRDVPEAVEFYGNVIGFDVMGHSRRARAAFVSAGGYHHHVGLNSWPGEGLPPPPEDSLSMRYFTILVPTVADLTPVLLRAEAAEALEDEGEDFCVIRDPSGNTIRVEVDPERG